VRFGCGVAASTAGLAGIFPGFRTMKKIMFAALVALLSPIASGAAHAEDWKVQKVQGGGTGSSSGFAAIAIDSKTGTYYTKQGYGFEGPSVQVYKDAAAFERGRPTGAIDLQGDTTSGTYMTAIDGQLFARTFTPTGQWDWPEGNVFGRWDLASGQLTAKAEMPGMTGRNGYDTFNWGGFSALNVMQDQTGTYVLGTDGTGIWTINKIDEALNVIDQRSFEAPTLGYAFMKNGQVFLGNSFYNNRIDKRFDFASGTLSDADINLVGFANVDDGGWGVYLSTTAYDVNRDVLYFHNTMDNTTYRFGAAAAGVPEPQSWALLLAGFALTGLTIRRRKPAAVAA
jgi:hypothetical protein